MQRHEWAKFPKMFLLIQTEHSPLLHHLKRRGDFYFEVAKESDRDLLIKNASAKRDKTCFWHCLNADQFEISQGMMEQKGAATVSC